MDQNTIRVRSDVDPEIKGSEQNSLTAVPMDEAVSGLREALFKAMTETTSLKARRREEPTNRRKQATSKQHLLRRPVDVSVKNNRPPASLLSE